MEYQVNFDHRRVSPLSFDFELINGRPRIGRHYYDQMSELWRGLSISFRNNFSRKKINGLVLLEPLREHFYRVEMNFPEDGNRYINMMIGLAYIGEVFFTSISSLREYSEGEIFHLYHDSFGSDKPILFGQEITLKGREALLHMVAAIADKELGNIAIDSKIRAVTLDDDKDDVDSGEITYGNKVGFDLNNFAAQVKRELVNAWSDALDDRVATSLNISTLVSTQLALAGLQSHNPDNSSWRW